MKHSHSPFLILSVILTTPTCTVLAQGPTPDGGYQYTPISGSGEAQEQSYDEFVAASESTNHTHSVTFPGLDGETWTWRANVSNVHVSDAVQLVPDEGPLVDPTITHLTFDLQWPGGETLDEVFNQSSNQKSAGNSTVCVTALSLEMSSSLANKYSESDNGDCSSVLGEDCVTAFLGGFRPGIGGSCSSPDLDIQQCKNTLGPGKVRAFGNTQIDYRFGGVSRDTESGMGLYYRDSLAVNGTNTTLFDEGLSVLQIMALTNFGNENKLLCMRVDPEHTSAGNSLKASFATLVLAGSLAAMGAALVML